MGQCNRIDEKNAQAQGTLLRMRASSSMLKIQWPLWRQSLYTPSTTAHGGLASSPSTGQEGGPVDVPHAFKMSLTVAGTGICDYPSRGR